MRTDCRTVGSRTKGRKTFYPLLLCCWLLVLAAAFPAHSQSRRNPPGAERNILILNAFESNIPAFAKTEQGLSDALQADGIPIRSQFYEHLELVRNPGPEHRRLLVQLLHQRYDGRKIDFLITLFPEALNFLLREARGMFPGVPVMALFLPTGYEPPATERRIIHHFVIPDLVRTLAIARRLVPDVSHVYVASGSHPLDQWLEGLARRDFKKYEERLTFHYLSHLGMEEITRTVSAAPPDSIVLVTTYSQDARGRYQTTVEFGHRLARIAPVPVFGILDTLIGQGIVGGSLISFDRIGKRAGQMVAELLNGAVSAERFPARLSAPQLDLFDWHQLKRWNLSESDLPADSIVVNREFNIWDLKFYILGGIVFILAQSFLIAALLTQRRRSRKAEAESRKRRDELAHITRVATMGELSSSLAHEINQPLTAIGSNAAAARRFLARAAPDIEEVRQILDDIIRDNARASDVVRKTRALLRRETPRHNILQLNRIIEEVLSLVRGEPLLHGLGISTRLSPKLKTVRGDFRELQQVMLNLILNAGAAMENSPHSERKIVITTSMADGSTVAASVRDFGAGIDSTPAERLFEPFYTTKTDGMGMGLAICQRIITDHGGIMSACNHPEGGATFGFTLPGNGEGTA